MILQQKRLRQSTLKALRNIFFSLPILIGVMLLVSLTKTFFSGALSSFFQGNIIIDSLIGSVLGSILSGNPITSYVLGGELLSQGVSLLAVTAFIISWVTVGLVQLPAESMLLGKKFALRRNLLAFISSILAAILVTIGVSLV